MAFRNSRNSRQTRTAQTDHDVIEGLPVRHWRKKPINVSTAPEKDITRPMGVTSNGYRELPLPRDFSMLPETSRLLLRAARLGMWRKPEPQDDEKENDDQDAAEKREDGNGTFLMNRWTLVPRDLEEPEPEYLAKRRKGLPSMYENVNGVNSLATQMTKRKIKRLDADGKPLVWEVLMPEGQAVDGEVVEDDTSPTVAPPGTVIEGVGVANENGVIVAGEQPAPVPQRRRPPIPKKKKKHGPGRGRKKIVEFATDVNGDNATNAHLQVNEAVDENGNPARKSDANGVSPSGEDSIMHDAQHDEDEGSEEGSEEGDDDREEGELSPSPDAPQPVRDTPVPKSHVSPERKGLAESESEEEPRRSKDSISVQAQSTEIKYASVNADDTPSNPRSPEVENIPVDQRKQQELLSDQPAPQLSSRDSSVNGSEHVGAPNTEMTATQSFAVPTRGETDGIARSQSPQRPPEYISPADRQAQSPALEALDNKSPEDAATEINLGDSTEAQPEPTVEVDHQPKRGSSTDTLQNPTMTSPPPILQTISQFPEPPASLPSPKLPSPPPQRMPDPLPLYSSDQYRRPSGSTPKAPTPSPPTPIEIAFPQTLSPKAPTMSPPTPVPQDMLLESDGVFGNDPQNNAEPPPFSLDSLPPPQKHAIPGLQSFQLEQRIDVEAAPKVEQPHLDAEIPHAHDPLDGFAAPEVPPDDRKLDAVEGAIDVEAAPRVDDPKMDAEIPHAHNPLDGLRQPDIPPRERRLQTLEAVTFDDGDEDLMGTYERDGGQ